MIFPALPTRASWDALLIALWLGIFDLLLYRWVSVRPSDWLRYLLMLLIVASILLAVLLIYRAWSLFSLKYRIGQNSLQIEWSGGSQTIALTQLKRIAAKGSLPRPLTNDWWRWPCNFIRMERGRDDALLTMVATRPIAACVMLDTGNQLLALSPAAPREFLRALEERYKQASPTEEPTQSAPANAFDIRYLLSQDTIARNLLLAGQLTSLLLFAILLLRYPFLPDSLAIRFGRDGLPELVRAKSGLFLLPMIGLFAWVVNGIWGIVMAARNQITGAYLLWGGSIIVNLYLFFALVSLVS